MLHWCYLILCCLIALLLLYGLLEIHYFLRMCLCVLLARFVKRKCHILDMTTVSGVCLTNDIDTLLYHMNNARYLRELDFARVDFYERTNLYKTIIAKGGSVFQGATTIRYRRFIRPFRRFQIKSRITYWDDESVYMEHRFTCPSDQFVHCIAICRQRIINCSTEEVMNELLISKNSTLPIQSSQADGVGGDGDNSGGGGVMATTTITIEDDANAGGSTINTKTTNITANIMTTNLDQAENGQVCVKLKPEVPPEIVKWIEYNDLSSKNLRKGC